MRTVFFVSQNDFETAWQSSSTALTAAALGDEVICIFSFAALRGISAGKFGGDVTGPNRQTAVRAEEVGAAHPQEMLAQLQKMGARFLACDTTVKMCGLSAETLVKTGCLNGVEGLTSLWKLTDNARVLTF